MKTLGFSGIALIMTLFMSCSKKVDMVNTNKSINDTINIVKTINYVINSDLSLINYSEYKGISPKDGFVPTADIAFKIAELILNRIYGEEKIELEKPFSINLENGIWVIEGHLDEKFLGGVAYIEIRKSNGEVLKVIHGK
ncbi:MAG: YbbC/YhhH family protein [Dysgonamonadaceae bacterium]|jgi:hypothetical protein|nr:YbbC/YhhH family protein [Dysgonamonadaceae bacterium]